MIKYFTLVAISAITSAQNQTHSYLTQPQDVTSDLKTRDSYNYIVIGGLVLGGLLGVYKLSNMTLRATKDMLVSVRNMFDEMRQQGQVTQVDLQQITDRLTDVEAQLVVAIDKTKPTSLLTSFTSKLFGQDSVDGCDVDTEQQTSTFLVDADVHQYTSAIIHK